MPVVTRQRPGMAAPPDSITQIALASPLCAQASNPGALVSLSMNHLTPRGTGGGQACPYRETAIARKNPPRGRKAARHEDPVKLAENAACELMLAAAQGADRGTVS